MRTVALLLLFTLLGPAVSAAVCELVCAEAAHHTAHAAATSCHDEAPASGRPTVSGTAAAPCHGHGDGSIAILVAVQLLMPATVAIVEAHRPLEGDMRPASFGRTAFRPPDRLPARTLLRI